MCVCVDFRLTKRSRYYSDYCSKEDKKSRGWGGGGDKKITTEVSLRDTVNLRPA